MTKLEIKARENGPYKIVGSFTYIDSDGQNKTTVGPNIALCRCGQSAAKPFCDGTHRKIKFRAPLVYLYLDEPEAAPTNPPHT